MIEIEKYIQDWFIKVDIKNVPPSIYIIRKTLLKAVDELKPVLKGKVLDLGCGVMPYKNYLNNPNIHEYVGIDLKEPTAYQNFSKPDLYWDGINIPVEDNSCDYVIATEFLEHYYDTSHILFEINRVLKKGGVLFFTVPSIWPIHAAPFDYHRFTPFCLFEHFQRAKFSKWDIKALGGLHLSVALIISFWFERIPEKRKGFVFKFLLFKIINFLIKRDKSFSNFYDGQIHSGLYGFVVK